MHAIHPIIVRGHKRCREESKSGGGGPQGLPIDAMRSQLIAAVQNHQTTIVVGETGSGKSSRLPRFLYHAMKTQLNAVIAVNSCLVCTQPRRVAAITIAQRVAEEMHSTPVGQGLVGYTVRFDDLSSTATRIKYVTDGVLLREAMTDADLIKYSVVILDEAHERSLQTDVLMGLLQQIQRRRPSLRIIVMSATLDIDLFTSFFEDVTTVVIPGRQYPVQALYLRTPEEDFLDAAMLTCLQIHEDQPDDGDVLVFLPGQDDIEALGALLTENLKTCKMLKTVAGSDMHNKKVSSFAEDFEIRFLYAAMPPDEQLLAFQKSKPGVRKFILSTNIAETSVTISGIKYVVDSGFVKSRWIQPNTGMEMLKTVGVSKSQANQRAGRAGRESPGIAYRLFTESDFEKLQDQAIPEIQRVPMAQVILNLLCLGATDILDFPFLSPPSTAVIKKGLEQLLCFGAIDAKSQKITSHGKRMAALPLDPQYAHMLLRSPDFGCVAEALSVVSLLSSESIFVNPMGDDRKRCAFEAHRKYYTRDGDISSLLNAFDSWKKTGKDRSWAAAEYLNQKSLVNATNVRNQLVKLLLKLEIDVSVSCSPEREPLLKCVTSGLILQVARRNDGDVSTQNMDLDLKRRPGGSNFSFSSSAGQYNSRFNSSETAAPYKTYRSQDPVYIHPSSCLFHLLRKGLSSSGDNQKKKKLPESVVYADLLVTTKKYMRNLVVIDSKWLGEVAPHIYRNIKTTP